MKPQHLPLDRRSLEAFVFSLQLVKKQLNEEKKKLRKTNRCVKVRILFLEGILATHSRTDIPRHDSKESLYFFKDEHGESVLIEELEPDPNFMPEMKRIPLTHALTQRMKSGELGYVIQKVLFSYPTGSHELMLICFEKNIVEKI